MDEVYLARPALPELDGVTIEDFYQHWTYGTKGLNPKGAHNTALRAMWQNYNATTRTVYVGTDPTLLRLPGATSGGPPQHVDRRFYWRRREGFDHARVAPDPVAVAARPLARPAESSNGSIEEGDDEGGGDDGPHSPRRHDDGSDTQLRSDAGDANVDSEGDEGDEDNEDATAPALECDPDDEGALVRLSRVPLRKQALFHLRMLARHRAARSYTEWLTDDAGVVHETPMATCRALGLLDEMDEGRRVLLDEIDEGTATPIMLRSLVVQAMRGNYPMDEVLEEAGVFDALLEPGWSSDDVVADLADRLRAINSEISQYLPQRMLPWHVATELEREWEVAVPCHVWQQRITSDPELCVDAAQACVVAWVLCGAPTTLLDGSAAPDLATLAYSAPARTEVAFLLGSPGAGKSRVFKRINAEFGRRGMFVKIAATSNLAATAFERGSTVHALFDLKVDRDDDGNYQIALEPEGTVRAPAPSATRARLARAPQLGHRTLGECRALLVRRDLAAFPLRQVTPERDELLRSTYCGAILVDEGLAANCSLMQAVISFCDERNYRVRILINGDPEQLPPVVANGGEDATVAESLLSCWVYTNASARFVLRSQYRGAADPPWVRFCRTLADGSAPALHDHAYTDPALRYSAVAVPLIRTVWTHEPGERGDAVAERALRWLFGTTRDGDLQVYHAGRRLYAIQTATNTQREWWNERICAMRARERGANRHTYNGTSKANVLGGDEATESLAMEALSDEAWMFEHADHSVPVSALDLGVGDLIMLPVAPPPHARLTSATSVSTRPSTQSLSAHTARAQTNLDKVAGLVKNKVLRVVRLMRNAFEACDEETGSHHVLCRQPFQFNLTRALKGVTIHRRQLPAMHAWAITVDKAQGKTIHRSIVDLRKPYWQHGKANVALSRVPTSSDCAAYVNGYSCVYVRGCCVPVLRNVVYPGLVVA